MSESIDKILLQILIDEGTGKKLPEAKKDVEVLTGSIVGLQQANKKLREERNKLDTQSAEGAKRIQELNKLIDENNDLIKTNSSNLEKQRMNVGNYKRGVVDALKEVRIGGINVGDVVDKLSKANEDLFQGMIQGYKNSGIQAKLFGNAARTALTLTGIGILIAGLATIVVYWDDITEAIGLADSKQKKFLDNARKELDAQNVLLERRIRLLELWGAAQSEINRLTIPKLKDEIALNEQNIAQLEKEIKLAEFRNDVFFNTKERQESIDALKKSNEDLSAQVTFLLSKEQKETADANQKKIDEAKATADKLKALQEKEAKERQDQLNKDAKAFSDSLKEKKEEQEYIDGELKAMDEKEFDRRATQLETYSERQLDQMTETHRQELEAQKEQNDNLDTLYQEDAEAKREAEEKKNEFIRWAINASIDAAQEAAESMGGLARVRADNEIKKIRELEESKVLTKKQADKQIEEIERESFKRSKSLSIIQTIINTAQAIAAAFAPPPTGAGPVFGPIFAGIAAVTGALQIATIKAQTFALGGVVTRGKRYDNGGYVTIGGKSHAQGGTKFWGEDGTRFEAEKDEGIFIMKKSANKEYLSSLNVKHGGNSWGTKTWYAAQGGQIETRDAAKASMSARSMEKAMVNAMQHIDFYVRIDDINNSQETGRNILLAAKVIQ